MSSTGKHTGRRRRRRDEAGTFVTQRDIIQQEAIFPPSSSSLCTAIPENLKYCPQYRVGTPHKIRLNLINRDPTILIKAETTEVVEGEPARFIVERRWNDDLLEFETTVLLRASQNGHYVTGSLPTPGCLRPERDKHGNRTGDCGRLGVWRPRLGDHRAAAPTPPAPI